MGLPLSCLEARKETEKEAVHSLDHFGYYQDEVLFETGIERESARHLNAMVMSKEATNEEKNLVVHSENMITGLIRTKSVNRRQVWLRFLNRSQHERRHTAFLYGIPSMTRASANRIEIDI